jgi:hypothetical protein
MRFRSIVVAVAAILALGGLSAYAASSHSQGSLATATVQAPLHAESTNLLATATPIPIGSFLPRVTTSLPLTNTTTTTTTTTTTVAQQAETCETAEPAEAAETGEDAAEATEPAEAAETADQDTGENATTEDNDRAEQACQPPSAACVDALAALKALQTADRTEDAAEVKPTTDAARDADKTEDAAEKQAKRTAVRAVIAACGHGEHGD